ATIAGAKFTDSLWAHPFTGRPSRLGFELPCECRYLVGMCAFQDNQQPPFNPSVFRILSEERELWRSPVIRESGKLVPFKVELRGARRIELRVECAGSFDWNHAIWVDPMLQK